VRYIVMLVAILLPPFSMPQSTNASSLPSTTPHFSHAAQLYTVRHELQSDFARTLKRVAVLGYQEIELAGLFDHDPAQVRSMTDALNLQILGSHINWKRLRDDPDGLIEETRILGAKYMILAWLPAEERQTLAQWKDWINIMNDVAARAHHQGIGFAYHNHEFEFEPIDGVEPYDMLIAGVDRRYVAFELDLYWLTVAGRSPDPYFQAYPGGFPLIHAKDMHPQTTAIVDAGDGRIDFPAVLRQSELAGITHLIAEHDESPRPFRTLRSSLAYFQSLHSQTPGQRRRQ
jgi:sugar phosphate isomerase/epimerase